MKCLILLALCSLLVAMPSLVAAQSDVQERIRSLEQQLEALRELKASQDRAQSLREKQCYQVVPSRGFCSCLSTRLPAEVSFDLYVRMVGEGGQQAAEVSVIRDACAGELAR